MANPNSDMRVTRALLSEYAEKYKNWGKWGPDDEIGTLNYTKPEDIVGAIVFLASDSSSYITGQTFMIDGGLSAW